MPIFPPPEILVLFLRLRRQQGDRRLRRKDNSDKKGQQDARELSSHLVGEIEHANEIMKRIIDVTCRRRQARNWDKAMNRITGGR